ncbi:hypothetical protein [Streptomyces cadmiisoli]|uniref:hypothetical protein n=1 Tax=Streptomyces cadmiisoli TaxID=2184053 RepID=UPI003648A3F2
MRTAVLSALSAFPTPGADGSESVLPRTRRAVVVALTLLAASATALPLSHAQPAAAAAATTSVRQDFNGDG